MTAPAKAKQGTHDDRGTFQSADRCAAQASSSSQIRVRQSGGCGDIWDQWNGMRDLGLEYSSFMSMS